MVSSKEETRTSPASWTICLALLLATAGCGGRSYSPTNPTLARESLRIALNHWNAGGKPGDLAERSPPIVVGDEDWEAGKLLVRFDILEDERDDGANLHVPVRLVVADRERSEREIVVTYIVGTSPVVSIFRQ